MKYCPNCGTSVNETDRFCTNCGKELINDTKVNVEKENTSENKTNSTSIHINTKKKDLVSVIKVFLILATILQGLAIIPLLWCIPMSISVVNKLNRNEDVSLAMKILTFIFVSRVAGICLLILEIDEVNKN